jgi:DGQHR domain-containing protein
MTTKNEIQIPALEIRQGKRRVLYQFAIDGKQIDRIATVSRISRSRDAHVHGYQRPEAIAHISSIRKYLESKDPMVPNGIVIAFDKRVKFVPDKNASAVSYARTGTISIPIVTPSKGVEVPGWIVDGQQRTAAVRDADIDHFPMLITAFITDDEDEQREQFILVNSAKPLSKSLIYELLPGTNALLPPALARRKTSAQLVEAMNHDPASPFHHKIQTPTNPEGVIKDNSILRMLDNSLTEGALYRYRNQTDGTGDLPSMQLVLNSFWSAIAEVFPEDWESVPRNSRLVHGVGIVSMGYVMDAIADKPNLQADQLQEAFVKELRKLKPHCAWSAGSWNFDGGVTQEWNHLQNTSRDLHLLSNHLLSLHRSLSKRTR